MYFYPEYLHESAFMNTYDALQWRHSGRDGVSNHQPYDCVLNRLFRRRSKKTSKLRVTGLCVGNSPVTGEFLAQIASDAENVSIWWRHHGLIKAMLADMGIQTVSSFVKYLFERWYWIRIRLYCLEQHTCTQLTINYGISGKHNGSTRIWHFDLRNMAWHQLQISIVTLMQLSRLVLWTKSSTCKIYTQYKLQGCVILILRLKFSTVPRVSINVCVQ